MKRYKRTMCLTISILILSACGSEEGTNKPNDNITIVDQADAKDELKVKSIQRLKGVRAFQFLTDRKLIVTKENKEIRAEGFGANEVYAQNLGIYHLKNNHFQPLLPNNQVQHSAKLSPDNKQLFYKVDEGVDSFGYVLDIKSKKTKKLTHQLLYPGSRGDWLNSSEVGLVTAEGKVVQVNSKDNSETLLPTKERAVDVMKGQKGFYYIAVYNQLYFVPQSHSSAEKVQSDAVSVIPSPNGKQLALVQQRNERTKTLSITDLKGTEAFQLADSTQIFGVSWSPDGSKLAYNYIAEDGGMKGIFVADSITGDVTHLNVPLEYAADQLSWSPSGKQLAASTVQDNQVHTYVISLE
ncbi:TolB family protein [Priestia flexa]|uniref:TolB family protein n=1 Tax=Priestia flexa TaxID=86664 RepID=UPI001B329868|nr:PD40 domain-containing protein [Priestia flexa]